LLQNINSKTYSYVCVKEAVWRVFAVTVTS